MEFEVSGLKNQKNRTKIEQEVVEKLILRHFEHYLSGAEKEVYEEGDQYYVEDELTDELRKEAHAEYAYKHLQNVGFIGRIFDTGQPWMIYWNIHALQLLDHPKYTIENDETIKGNIIKFLSYCQAETGGFRGGPFQTPHLASTYAAVLALCTVGTEEAYNLIDRKKLHDFFVSCKNPRRKGSFLMNVTGECDMRGTYITMVIASLLNILTDELKDGVGDAIAACQTYEGGLCISSPMEEAHGGLTFCGFAAICAIREEHKIDLNRLLYWAVQRQMSAEGGFNGRTNKVVDACYSFWQCAIFKMLNMVTDNAASYEGNMLFNQLAVQMYVLICGQNEDGGLRDKPGKPADFYHTCYALSGLSICQEVIGNPDKRVFFNNKDSGKLKELDPIYNIEVGKLKKAREYFASLPKVV